MTEEEHIQKGFNAGYQLQRHNPELTMQIEKGFTDKDHPYAQGFTAGSREFTKEQSTSSYLDKQLNKAKQYQSKKQNNPDHTQKDKGMDL